MAFQPSLPYLILMEQYLDLKTLLFVLNDVHRANQLYELERFSAFDDENVRMFIESIKEYGDRVLHPALRDMDANGAFYKEGTIQTHPLVGQVLKDAKENGLISASFDHSLGGMQLPLTVGTAIGFILHAANNHVKGYLGLTTGSAELISAFGSQELKDIYLPHMLEGRWSGTMCLTEPQAGSSLSDVATLAVPTTDGSFRITGQKIFISGGDHQHSENIIHLVLARIEGAPSGTKGISLFVVPKNRIRADGTLEANDVTTAADFQKMGQKGYCTAHLIFGEKEDCHGYLVGEPYQGLRYMFKMMNAARIDVGLSAAGIASAAYHASLAYAKERPQGRKINSTGDKDTSEGQTLIINHPDVRRMLLFQKAVSEGSLALLIQTSLYYDLAKCGDADKKDYYHQLVELLTPIAKTYPSEMGISSVSNGLQVLGGYGFCKDFILEQYYRDIRIMALYEGTTGIQSLDLLGRKVTMNQGKALEYLVEEIQKTLASANEYEELKSYAGQLSDAMAGLSKVVGHLVPMAMKGEFEKFLADATLFMESMGTTVIAWQWLKMAVTARISAHSEEGFYQSKIHTMKYFFKYELTRTAGINEILMHPEALTLSDLDDDQVFG